MYNLGWDNETICGEKGFLCPTCKAKLEGYKLAQKEILEKIEEKIKQTKEESFLSAFQRSMQQGRLNAYTKMRSEISSNALLQENKQ